MNEALDQGRYVEIRGDAGVGKSGVLKHFAELFDAEGRIVVLSPGRTQPRGWTAMRNVLGFNGTARDLLGDLASDGGAALFIDNLDSFSDEERRTVNDLVRAAAESAGGRSTCGDRGAQLDTAVLAGVVPSIMKFRGTLAQAAPKELAALAAEGLIAERKEERDVYRRREREEPFQFLDHEFLPAAPAQGPFLELLTHAPDEGLALQHAPHCRGRCSCMAQSRICTPWPSA